MSTVHFLAVFIGGGLGALLRMTLFLGVKRIWPIASFPWGTLTVNLLGSALMGLILFLLAREKIQSLPQYFWGVGFLGALTTFSTFAADLFLLLKEGRGGELCLALLLNNVGCFGAVALTYLVLHWAIPAP